MLILPVLVVATDGPKARKTTAAARADSAPVIEDNDFDGNWNGIWRGEAVVGSDYSDIDPQANPRDNSLAYMNAMVEAVAGHIDFGSVSFVPYLNDPSIDGIRQFAYADYFDGNFSGVEGAKFALRDARYKLLRENGELEFYDLSKDPMEENNLLTGDMNVADKAKFDSMYAFVTEVRTGR